MLVSQQFCPFFYPHKLKFLTQRWGEGGQTFCLTLFVGGGGGYDDVDVDEKMDVSEVNFLVIKANILVSEAKKLSAEARISRALKFWYITFHLPADIFLYTLI